MFDRVSEAAERLAVHVSRRGFLGSASRWAGATALAMAGVLSTAGSARAGGGHTCCVYKFCFNGCTTCLVCIDGPGPCATHDCGGLPLVQSYSVQGCGHCKL